MNPTAQPMDAYSPPVGSYAYVSERSKLAQATLVSNGMVWFGASFMLFTIVVEQRLAVFARTWLNVLG